MRRLILFLAPHSLNFLVLGERYPRHYDQNSMLSEHGTPEHGRATPADISSRSYECSESRFALIRRNSRHMISGNCTAMLRLEVSGIPNALATWIGKPTSWSAHVMNINGEQLGFFSLRRAEKNECGSSEKLSFRRATNVSLRWRMNNSKISQLYKAPCANRCFVILAAPFNGRKNVPLRKFRI